jgi:hypothetical protein
MPLLLPKRLRDLPRPVPSGNRVRGRDKAIIQAPVLWGLGDRMSGLIFYVPKGTEVDGFSHPWIARRLGFSPFGDGWPASVVHDAGYRGAKILKVDLDTGEVIGSVKPNKARVDVEFMLAAIAFGTPVWQARLFFNMTQMFGERGWNADHENLMPEPPAFVPIELLTKMS